MFSFSGQSLRLKSASDVCWLWASTVVQNWPKQYQQIGMAPSSRTLFTYGTLADFDLWAVVSLASVLDPKWPHVVHNQSLFLSGTNFNGLNFMLSQPQLGYVAGKGCMKHMPSQASVFMSFILYGIVE